MTAEIVIMNKEAIALAADSAVTLGGEQNQKIYNSANKIFTLSKYYPVGIMLYGSAIFMQIPWETIIKVYRNKLGQKKFKTLKEYAKHFISFLEGKTELFPEEVQKNFLYATIHSYFDLIKGNISEEIKSIVNREGEITDRQIKQITSEVIEKHYKEWKEVKMLPTVPEAYIKKIIDKYEEMINSAKEEVFEKWPISSQSLNQLKVICGSLFSKDRFPSNISGIVIAGFGEEDTFPSIESFLLEGIVDNKMKYARDRTRQVNFENTASIIPFAQGEMIATFMEGIDPYYKNSIESYLSEIFDEYTKIIVENIPELDESKRNMFMKKLGKASDELLKYYKEKMRDYREKRHIGPIMAVVANLPKNELATIAETLVNLTSFKQKITMRSETVGGPIDVAVISKGDDFIWIKRKHYFKPELNPQFFANYYKEVKNEKK